jgi:hypothetical protein
MIEFKSISEHYYPERDGFKNWTIREIDNDDRFSKLFKMMKSKNYDLDKIKISLVEFPNTYFIRQIKHICIWEDYYICITWRS